MIHPKPHLKEDQLPPVPKHEHHTKTGSHVQNVVSADHLFSQIHLRHKLKLAQTLLENYSDSKFLVFCGRKRDKFLLNKYLTKAGMQTSLAAEAHTPPSPKSNAPIIISSDDCLYLDYKGDVTGILHFDIPQKLSSYANRMNALSADNENISHAIVTQREVAMLEDFNTQLGIEARAEIIPGFEDDFKPTDDIPLRY